MKTNIIITDAIFALNNSKSQLERNRKSNCLIAETNSLLLTEKRAYSLNYMDKQLVWRRRNEGKLNSQNFSRNDIICEQQIDNFAFSQLMQ